MITFTRRTQTYDEATDTMVEAVTTITGSGLQVRGNPARYKALGLVLSVMPTLLFTPDTYGLKAGTDEFVLPGDTIDWNGVPYTVRDIDPIAPDGIVIMARIVIGGL